MNLNNITSSEYLEGQTAYKEGKTPLDNPYIATGEVDQFLNWELGYLEAVAEDD
jgi:hypothetical protein